MRRRLLEKYLRAAGCQKHTPDKGPHTKWVCPCGAHTFPLPRHNEVSPGVVADARKKLTCLPKGWLP